MNVLEAVDKIYQHLVTGPVSALISGRVYKNGRPINSRSEDIVINSLGLNNTQLQTGVLNVNIHVPNEKLRINGIETNDQPNHIRQLAITAIVLSELDEVWDPKGNYVFEVQQHNLIKDEDESFINIRLEIFNINITK